MCNNLWSVLLTSVEEPVPPPLYNQANLFDFRAMNSKQQPQNRNGANNKVTRSLSEERIQEL